ncbi:MAG: prepilin-type N-terminal cleavage/methylation domain-containing protein [bacterium]
MSLNRKTSLHVATPRGPVRRSLGAGGFTLMEVLIAFAILAMALPALLHLGSTGLDGMDRAQRVTAAVDLAESLLAQAGQGAVLAPGTRSGESGGLYRWTLRIEREEDIGFEARLVEPYRITAEITAPRMRTVTLTTVRLRPRGAR